MSKINKGFAEKWREVEGYVNKQPAWKRQRYEHMTIREIKQEMSTAAATTRVGHRCQARGRVRRPAMRRRTSSSSRTSSADPGDSDGTSDPAPLHHPRYGRVNANLLAVLEAVAS